MSEKGNKQTSPYYQPQNSVSLFKINLVQYLDLLRMPIEHQSHEGECSRDCHIAERNSTIEAIKHYVSNVQGGDK